MQDDFSEQAKARDALLQRETRLRAMLEAVPDMIFELSRDGSIVQFIPSASDDLMMPGEVIGRNIADVLPMAAEQAKFIIERALASEQVNAFDFQLQVNGEEKTFEARITSLGDDLVLAIVRDITLQRWALSEREGLIDELESKNAELERFTYTASHDLKSPLITIKGFLGFLEKDIAEQRPERVHGDVLRINEAVDKMHRLLTELLELSRIGRMMNASEQVSFHELVQTALDNIHGRLAPRNITVLTQPNLPAVHGDRQRLTEVLQNLLDNAAKYMGAQPDPRIEVGQQGAENNKPIFYVKDNGIGIAPEYHERIFGLFNKLDPKSDGTGIGLALVKRIVEVHGGRVWLESDGVPGKGSTFYFTLPDK
jgi:PAS domain S-box-containing protein